MVFVVDKSKVLLHCNGLNWSHFSKNLSNLRFLCVFAYSCNVNLGKCLRICISDILLSSIKVITTTDRSPITSIIGPVFTAFLRSRSIITVLMMRITAIAAILIILLLMIRLLILVIMILLGISLIIVMTFRSVIKCLIKSVFRRVRVLLILVITFHI